jgi:hypothetical protein
VLTAQRLGNHHTAPANTTMPTTCANLKWRQNRGLQPIVPLCSKRSRVESHLHVCAPVSPIVVMTGSMQYTQNTRIHRTRTLFAERLKHLVVWFWVVAQFILRTIMDAVEGHNRQRSQTHDNVDASPLVSSVTIAGTMMQQRPPVSRVGAPVESSTSIPQWRTWQSDADISQRKDILGRVYVSILLIPCSPDVQVAS